MRERVRRPELLILGGIVLVAVLLRALRVGESVVFDETFTRIIALQPTPSRFWDQFMLTEDTPPLFYVLDWVLAKGSHSAFALRLPAFAPGIGLVPVVWLLARRAFDRRAALVAAALMALSPWAVFYSTEARAYSLMAFFVACSTLLLLEALDRPRATWWWVAYVLAAVAALYSHYTAIFAIGVQGLWALWAGEGRRRAVFIAHAAVGVAFLPWLPQMDGSKARGAIAIFSRFTPGNVVRQELTSLVGTGNTALGIVPGVVGWVIAATVVAAAVLVIARLVREHRPPRPEAVLFAGLAVAAPVCLILYSAFISDLFIARNTWASLPAVAVAVAALVTRAPGRAGQVLAGVLVVATAVITVKSLDKDLARPDYAGVAAYLEDATRPGDTILESPVLPAEGPPRTMLTLNLPQHFRIVEADLAGTCAWRVGPSGGRIFLVAPVRPGWVYPPKPPAGTRRVATKVFRGQPALRVDTYRSGVPPTTQCRNQAGVPRILLQGIRGV